MVSYLKPCQLRYLDRNNNYFSVRSTDIGKSIRVEQNGKKQDETDRGRQLCRVDGEPCE